MSLAIAPGAVRTPSGRALFVKNRIERVLDLQALRGRPAAGKERRDADERMKEAVQAVVDDLARRHGHLGRLVQRRSGASRASW